MAYAALAGGLGLLKPLAEGIGAANLGYAAAGAGVGGLKAAYNYFAKTATKDYGHNWQDQMNLNQIRKLAKSSVMKTRKSCKPHCKSKRTKKKSYKKRGQYKRKTKTKKKKKTKRKRKTF